MFTTRPEILGHFGVAASTHWLASSTAMAVLEQGGNAFDAGVAAGFVLQVAEPHLNGPGGDCPILLHDARTNRQHAICGQGPAPHGATIAHYRDQLGLDIVPGTGLLAAVVPGAFDAWMLLLRDWGTWPLARVLDFALGYAIQGIPVLPRIAAAIATVQPMFEAEWTSSAPVFLPGGAVPEVGSAFANPSLAATYARILKEAAAPGRGREAEIEAARRAWYQGFVADAVEAFFASTPTLDTSGRRHLGVLRGSDFAAWQATVEAPVGYDYRGHRVLKCGPWSQGPVFLQTLALLQGFDLAELDPTGPEFVHLVVEAQKLAFADREAWYGDPDFTEVPLDALLSEMYNAARRTLIGPEASLALRPGDLPGRPAPWVDHEAASRTGTASGAGEPTVAPLARLGASGGDTCHIDVIDRWGNMVAATPSAGWLQSSPVVPGLGFPMGTRGQMFRLREGLPTSLGPGRRPRTTLSPSLMLTRGQAAMAFGTPGGEQQDQWSLAFLLRVLERGMNLQEAIDAPAFHSEHWPSSFWPRSARPGRLVLEDRFPTETVTALRARGHLVELGGPWSEGRLSATRIEGGWLRAAANPRGMQGYAVGR